MSENQDAGWWEVKIASGGRRLFCSRDAARAFVRACREKGTLAAAGIVTLPTPTTTARARVSERLREGRL